MKEYCASFFGPSIDSKRYAVGWFFWSFENISRGCSFRVILFIFRVLAGLVCVDVVPKAIPQCCSVLRMVQKHTPMFYLRLICTKLYITA